MSVLIVTSLGDIVVDLYTDKCPLTSKNFLKLCKIKYYNGCLFHTARKDFIACMVIQLHRVVGIQFTSGFLYGDQARFFSDEIHLDLKHTKVGMLQWQATGENQCFSWFYITLRDDLDYLDGKHTVFGEVAEGHETLTRINEAYVDDKNRPYKNIRIKHTYILDDPFEDPSQLTELIPESSPEGRPKDEADDEVRLEDDWVPMDEQLGPTELDEIVRAKEAHSSAVVLESIGDIPDAEIKPPDNVLFVCKLNPVTEDEDLHTIFSRFGTVISAEVIRDYKTGDSLCYAFIEFETKEACEQAYFKMDNALIDDRRIHVDFSQSVSKLWSQFKRKDNQMGKGKGCSKCGAMDHMAKYCVGDPTSNQPSKYIIKDDNEQRGGENNSRYEMVFDEDYPESPRLERTDGHHDPSNQIERQKMRRSSEDLEHRQAKKKDLHDRYGRSERNRGYAEDERHHERKASHYLQVRLDRENYRDRRTEVDNGRHGYRDYKNVAKDGEDRGYGRVVGEDNRKRRVDRDGRRDMREDRDGRERYAETDSVIRKGNVDRKSTDEDDRKRSANESRRGGHLGDDTHNKRRYVDSDRRDLRNEVSGKDNDRYKGKKETEHRHRGAANDSDHDRRHRGDKRR
ncbi:hypothetical protein K2173_007187 [Erythroxylum novogranatense]|uniref:Peptidyl-prolyl cis-trans isomerase n=1 Tax=Erythroxylum novogranatense TaxID=1862640 RepID=A0AAV8T7B2_9ROSI|nr:hypothetical protein K2173_007187 [Erythroxylum novogranatense]